MQVGENSNWIDDYEFSGGTGVTTDPERRAAMTGRRELLQGALVFASAAVMGSAGRVQAAGPCPVALFYTKDAPGRWAGKEDSHAPTATVAGKTLTVVTPHPMTEKHFIVKHTVVTPDGTLIGEKTFVHTDPTAESSYALPDGFQGPLLVASFCNLHDLWVTTLTI
jgi:superoxide reductase